jgi:hypothetical protein
MQMLLHFPLHCEMQCTLHVDVVVVVFQCHHMSIMDFVVSLLVVAEV